MNTARCCQPKPHKAVLLNMLTVLITQEIRVYDLDTELPACTVKYGSQNARVNQMKWWGRDYSHLLGGLRGAAA